MSIADDRLQVIQDLIREFYNTSPDLLLSTKLFIDNLLNVATGKEYTLSPPRQKREKIIISCDASFSKENVAAIGVVIEFPENHKLSRPPIEISMTTKDKSINAVEYTAISAGLLNLMQLFNNPNCEIEVRSDSQLAIKQIKNEWKCKDKVLEEKKKDILELLQTIPAAVKFVWRPSKSTTALAKADLLAKTALGKE